MFVDAANKGAADGTVARPHKSLAAAIASAANDAILCVAEGTYAEALTPGVKYFTLLGTLTCSGATGDSWKVLEGNTLQRKNPARPEVEGRYRLASPTDVPVCP